MAEEKKPNYLEEALGRIAGSLSGITLVEEEQERETFLGDVRKELVQSFKNGIEVGRKRALNPKGAGKAVPVGAK